MKNTNKRAKDLLFWFSRKTNYPFLPPEVLQISLTHRCNLRCGMCAIAGLNNESEELSTDQIKSAINQASCYGIKQVVFTGGEPFIRDDLFEVAGYAHQNAMISVVTTNGTLMDEKMASDIVDCGINHIHISLDGLKETHNSIRGPGAFTRVIKAIDSLRNLKKENKPTIGIAFTVMDTNVGEMFSVLKLADTQGVDIINFQTVINDNANFPDNRRSSFFVSREKIKLLKEQIDKIRKYIPHHVVIQEEPQLELFIKYYQGTLRHKDWVCFGGFKTVFVCFSQKKPLVYSCHGTCGNLEEISLKDAWTSFEAKRLRLHSERCNSLCLQSCYSYKAANTLGQMLKTFSKINRRYG